MVTGVTFLGSAGLGVLLVLVGIFLGFSHADLDHGADAAVDGDANLDGDGGQEAESDSAMESGLSLLSLAGMGALLMGFGSAGYSVWSLGASAWLSVLVGMAGALVVFRLTAWVKRLLVRNLETGSSARQEDLVYQPATVTVPIPPAGKGRGQVMVRKGGRVFYVSARTELDRELNTGEQVVITASGDGAYLVDTYQI